MSAMRAAGGVVAVMMAFGTTGAVAAPPDEPGREVLEFLDLSRLVAVHDAGARGSEPQPGDVYVFDNWLRHPDRSDAVTRQPLGRFPSTCTVVQGTQVTCEGTLELRDGSLSVSGTPDLAVPTIDMVVTGGTGRYATATGSAQLTATDRPGTSRLVVVLDRPAP